MPTALMIGVVALASKHLGALAIAPPHTPHKQHIAMLHKPPPTVTALAFLAGCSDILCMHHFKCFALMQTGNSISAATALVACRWADVAFYSALVLNYVGGAAIFRAVASRRTPPLRLGLPLAAAFCLVDLLSLSPALCTRWRMTLLATAFGFVNSFSVERTGVISAMLTGHLFKMGNTIGAWLSRSPTVPDARANVRIWLALIGGAILSSVAVARLQPTRGYSLLGLGYGGLVALHEHHRLESPMGELKAPVREGSVSAGVSSPAAASRGEAPKNQ